MEPARARAEVIHTPLLAQWFHGPWRPERKKWPWPRSIRPIPTALGPAPFRTADRGQRFGVHDLSTMLERSMGDPHWRCGEGYTAYISRTREDGPQRRDEVGHQTSNSIAAHRPIKAQ